MWTPQPPPVARSQPPTVVGLRILVVLQIVAVAVGAVQAIVFTVSTASDSNGDTLEGFFQGLGALIGAVCTVVAGLVLAATVTFAVVLRPGPPRRRTASLIVVGILEGVAILPAGVLAIAAFSNPLEPDIGTVPAVFTLAGIAVIVLAIVPATRAWARGPVPPTQLPPGQWPPGPPPGQWPPAPWGAPYGAP